MNSSRVVTDGAGAVAYSVTHSPFGDMEKEFVKSFDPKPEFSGKEREGWSDWDYFGARYYDHGMYRFTSVDPVINKDEALTNPQLWNLYSYCRNNPTTFLDPDGREDGPVLVDIQTRANLENNIGSARADYMMSVYNRTKESIVAGVSAGILSYLAPEIAFGIGIFNTSKSSMSFDWTRANHIFRNAEGHINPKSNLIKRFFAKIVEKVVSNPKNLDNSIIKSAKALKNGVEGYTKYIGNGKQIWAETRNDRIINAGINILRKR